MISIARTKYIRTLHDKKTRLTEGVYLVEGRKILEELIVSNEYIVELYITEEFAGTHREGLHEHNYEIISEKELEKITTLQSNNAGLAVVKMRENRCIRSEKDQYVLILDGINDPGNLGTIIRIADWYGISKIVCSLDTVEYTNPKVIMASMGSFLRVSIYYTNLDTYLSGLNEPIYGAYLDGEDIYTKKITKKGGYIVIGSEAHGIRLGLEKYITDKITIPRFGQAESLNAGVATAILLDNIRRML